MVSDNFLSNTIRGVAIGGGRDNIIENNVIVGSLASIQLDARGKTWAKHHIDGEHSRIHQLCRRTLAESPICAQRHSELANMLDDELASPKGNSIRMNSFDSRIGIDLQGVDTSLVAMTGNARRPSADLACISSSGSRRGARAVNFQQRFEPACGIIPGTTYGPS